MTSNPASDISVDPLEYYTRQSKRKRSVHRESIPDLRGVIQSDPSVRKKSSSSSPPEVVDAVSKKKSPRKKMDCCLATLRCLENIPVIGHGVSALYACFGNKDKAERAGLKATVGILCFPCNFPVEIVDELTAKRSPKLDSPGLMSRTDWMKRHKKRQLRHICLPGSHQSGTYNMAAKLKQIPLVEGWSRCQSLSIDAQLHGGIRFFDLRIMSYDSSIWLHHNLVVCVPLREVLEKVRDFVAEFPSEIVGLYITNDGKPVDWGLCQSFLNEILGEKLIHEHMKDMLIGDIVDQGRNVIISGVPHVAYSWTGIQYRWPNKSWPDEICEDMEITLTDIGNNRPNASLYWYKAEATPNTPMVVRNLGGLPGYISKSRGGLEKFEFLQDMAYAVNYVVHEILTGVTKLPFNVLSVDYVQDDIVGLIIQLNDKADEGLYTAEESAEADDVFSETSSLVTSQPRGRGAMQSTSSSKSGQNTSFDIRLKPGAPLEVKESNI